MADALRISDAARSAASEQSFSTVVAPVADPEQEGTTYSVVEDDRTRMLYVSVERARKGKDASVKRVPLAPLAAAQRLGVISL